MKLKNNETLTKRITNCKSCSIQNDRDIDIKNNLRKTRYMRVAIECKNYLNEITVGKVRDFHSVLSDIGNINGIKVM